ncbi:Cthe_2314 family HEPN domain-containing protein [Paenibacillus sp. FSL K6-2862]|uniref:Cthe_2314 family HEPN domain-containing protein n=1 Tax=Paenibacillus sp. FSL K6-2862 TaxID=2921484 RepID=UPI0030F703BF
MNIIDLQIDPSYLEKAMVELNLSDFPSTEIIGKMFDAMGGTLGHTQKMQSMINWIDLLEKKYREAITSIIYGLAHQYKQQEDRAYSPNQPFFNPPTSYFTENAVSRAFSLVEKLAQLLNVFEDLGIKEQGSSREAVSFGKIQALSKTTDLAALERSLKTLSPERHAHTHGMTPEMTRHNISSVSAGSINGERPMEVIVHSIDESKLPVTPYQQLLRCKNVMENFTVVISKVFEVIDNDLDI